MTALSRRSAVQQIILVGAGLTTLPELGWAGFQLAGRELVPFEDFPEDFAFKRPGAETLPGGNALGIDLREQTAPKTVVSDTFIVSHYNTPQVDAASWSLKVDGAVGRPLVFSLAEIRRRPRIDKTVTFECGGNRDGVMHRMLSTVTWTGCSLTSVLEEARPGKDVLEAIFWGSDQGEETIRGRKYQMHFARSMSLPDALGADAILAYEADGQPLPIVHGFPVRLVVPGWYGVSNVKWLERIELSPRRYMGRFMGRDYVTIAGRQVGDTIEYTETSVTRILVKSLVARVSRPAAGLAGSLTASGIAYGDGTPIQRVDVQVDGGAWKPARLDSQPNPFAWTFWTADIGPLAPGPHTVASRAFDRTGRTQPADLSMKQSNWENNAIWTRKIRV
ncbi:MAG: molybdopterin-dependent oxidoreductase [Vicinamibacterales bacterium]